ncbi:hypothetical protein AQ768_06520 [Burkholderia pseudomallei]|nr:hypothetical protein AQ768_06520 [Burkholderia pseudomallei]
MATAGKRVRRALTGIGGHSMHDGSCRCEVCFGGGFERAPAARRDGDARPARRCFVTMRRLRRVARVARDAAY